MWGSQSRYHYQKFLYRNRLRLDGWVQGAGPGKVPCFQLTDFFHLPCTAAPLLTLICHPVIWEQNEEEGVANGSDTCGLEYEEAGLPGFESQFLCVSLLKLLNLCRYIPHVWIIDVCVCDCVQVRGYDREQIVKGSRGNVTDKENAWKRTVSLLFWEEQRRGVMIHSYWVDLMLQKALSWEEEICLFFIRSA